MAAKVELGLAFPVGDSFQNSSLLEAHAQLEPNFDELSLFNPHSELHPMTTPHTKMAAITEFILTWDPIYW